MWEHYNVSFHRAPPDQMRLCASIKLRAPPDRMRRKYPIWPVYMPHPSCATRPFGRYALFLVLQSIVRHPTGCAEKLPLAYWRHGPVRPGSSPTVVRHPTAVSDIRPHRAPPDRSRSKTLLQTFTQGRRPPCATRPRSVRDPTIAVRHPTFVERHPTAEPLQRVLSALLTALYRALALGPNPLNPLLMPIYNPLQRCGQNASRPYRGTRRMGST
jgi:hypothetical protein